jgi:hypothetical protein
MSPNRPRETIGRFVSADDELEPHPGTVAYHNPEPQLITDLRTLVSDGTGRRDAVRTVTTWELDRDEVEAAHTYWVGQMPRFAWDDHTGTHVLMILEDALRELPRGK